MSNSVSNKSLERKVRKPKIEKLRRARINTSLEQLKDILLRNTISIPQDSRPMKLDKADILAMTVKYVEMLHKKLTLESPKNEQFPLNEHQRALSDVTNIIKSHTQKSLILSDKKLPTFPLSRNSLQLYKNQNFPQRNFLNENKENSTKKNEDTTFNKDSRTHWRPW